MKSRGNIAIDRLTFVRIIQNRGKRKSREVVLQEEPDIVGSISFSIKKHLRRFFSLVTVYYELNRA